MASPSPHDEGAGRGAADLLFSERRLQRRVAELCWIRWDVPMIFQLPLDFHTTGSSMKHTPNLQKDSFPVASPLMIPNSQFFNSLLLQELCSNFIPLALIWKAVHKSIQFDRQFCRRTIKIEKVCCERMLPAKFKTDKSASAQGAPKLFLFRSLLATQTPGICGGIHQMQSSAVDGRNKKPLSLALSPLLRRGERECPPHPGRARFRGANLIPDL